MGICNCCGFKHTTQTSGVIWFAGRESRRSPSFTRRTGKKRSLDLNSNSLVISTDVYVIFSDESDALLLLKVVFPSVSR